MTEKEKIKMYLENQGISKNKFYQVTGLGIGFLDSGKSLGVDKLKIITMYVTTQRELVAVYGGTKKVPPFLKRKVDYNQSKYTERGKTI